MNIGYNIKRIRELKGYNQQHMAEQLGMTQSNYSKLESDPKKVTMDTLQKIADVLDVDVFAIMAFDEKMVFNIQRQEGSNSNGLTINNFPAKLQELYEARIKGLEEEVRFLRNQLSRQRME